jgi:hypothetical protein
MCCLPAKHATLRRQSKDWLARNRGNASESGDMFFRELLSQWSSTLKIQLSVLVYNKAYLIDIPLTINLFSPLYSWTIAEMVLSNNHSLT